MESFQGGAELRMAEQSVNAIDLNSFLTLRRHLKIVHHIPGRVRLRIGAAVFKELGSVDTGSFDNILETIEGIKDVRVNASAGSVVINYAPANIKPSWWDTLVHGEDSKAMDLLKKLLTEKLTSEAVLRSYR
jgi:hypothetical protein